MSSDKYAILRHEGIVYLIKREHPTNKEPYDVYTYDLENPVKVGTWTSEGGVRFTNENILRALQESRTTEELVENISQDIENA